MATSNASAAESGTVSMCGLPGAMMAKVLRLDPLQIMSKLTQANQVSYGWQ